MSTLSIPHELAYRAHCGTSMVPEDRARAEQEDFARTMQADYNNLAKNCKTDTERAQLAEQFERYRAGYHRRLCASLSARARVMSPMITGPSNFPVHQNEKRCSTYQRRIGELIEYRKRALRAIGRILWPVQYSIPSSAPDAVSLLQAEIDKKRAFQELMKAANKLVRSKLGDEEKISAIVALGIPEQHARELLKPDFCGRVGFPDYALQNNLAEIKRLERRVASVSAMKSSPYREEQRGDVLVIRDPDAGRIQLKYPGKPDHSTRDTLKKNGFRWAHSLGVWQRHLNRAGENAVDCVLGKVTA